MSSHRILSLCLRCHKRFSSSRGMCRNCYTYTRLAIKKGKTTWEQEMEAGRAMPPGKPSITFFFGRGKK